MTLDIRGSLKNTKINRHHYATIDELFSNAIDSYLIRKDDIKTLRGLSVEFSVDFFDKDLDGTQFDLKIMCTDNGAGMGANQIKAYTTKDTSYKDDLSINGIGKCKGSGRVQFLHYFSKLSIDSVFCVDKKFKNITLNIDDNTKEIDKNSFAKKNVSKSPIKTTFTLKNIKPEIYDKIFIGKDLKNIFSPESLKQHIMIYFLQRLISLKEDLGDFSISFTSTYKKIENNCTLTPKDLPDISSSKTLSVYHLDLDGAKTEKFKNFTISHYKLDKTEFNLKKNTVALCAKSSAVKPITSRYLKIKTLENNDINGFYHIILIESDFLDTHVNEQRDNFDIPNESHNSDIFLGHLLSMDDICNSMDDYIINLLSPPDWSKETIINKVENKYGISSDMINEMDVRVHYGDTEETIAKRALSLCQVKIIKDTSDIFDIKEEISKTTPHSDDFRKKINDLAWKYTSSLKNIDMANLSQLVVRRTAILEILQLAINEELITQAPGNNKNKKNEEIIHNIFFPMRKDSEEIKDHDIWILNEEYHYFDYIASDKALSKIKWGDNTSLFDSNIDTELEEILQRNYNENTRKRPDIAIFNKEGSAIIIEFKSPGVDMEKHTGDLMEYAQLLAAKSNGRLKKFYGYLIGTDVTQNRLTNYTRFPSGKGWFNTVNVIAHDTGHILGELYSEIVFYSDIVDRAKIRLDVYKKRLNLKIK